MFPIDKGTEYFLVVRGIIPVVRGAPGRLAGVLYYWNRELNPGSHQFINRVIQQSGIYWYDVK